MLPFTREQFLGVFVTYNDAIWPLQIVIYLFGIVVVALLFRPAVPLTGSSQAFSQRCGFGPGLSIMGCSSRRSTRRLISSVPCSCFKEGSWPMPDRTSSEGLLSPFGAIEFHMRFSVLDASPSFGDLQPSVEGLPVAPEFEDVDAICVQGICARS